MGPGVCRLFGGRREPALHGGWLRSDSHTYGKVGYYVALVVSDSVNSNELGWAGVGWKVRCTWRGKHTLKS